MDSTLAYTRLSLGSLTTTLSLICWDRPISLVTAMVLGLLVSFFSLACHALVPNAHPLKRALLWFAVGGVVLATLGSMGVAIPPTALLFTAAANGLVQMLVPTTVSEALNR